MDRSGRNRSIALAVGTLLLLLVAWFLSHATSAPRARTVVIAPTSRPATTQDPVRPRLHFEDGTTWQLQGIREYPAGTRWWGANGSPVPEPGGPPPFVAGSITPKERLLELRVTVTGENAERHALHHRILHLESAGSRFEVVQPVTVVISVSLIVPADAISSKMWVAIVHDFAVPPVHVDVDLIGPTTKATTRPTTAPSAASLNITFADFRYDSDKGDFIVELIDLRTTEQRRSTDYDMHVIDTSGKTREVGLVGNGPRNGPPNRRVFRFRMPRGQVATVALEIHKKQWLETPTLAYRPR